MGKSRLNEGTYHKGVLLQTYQDGSVSRPRVRPVSHFEENVNVRFPRKLREDFPIGTMFRACVKVCQKHWNHNGEPKGQPYLHVDEADIEVIIQSIPDPGLRAKLKPGTVSGRAYIYVME